MHKKIVIRRVAKELAIIKIRGNSIKGKFQKKKRIKILIKMHKKSNYKESN